MPFIHAYNSIKNYLSQIHGREELIKYYIFLDELTAIDVFCNTDTSEEFISNVLM